MPHLTPFYFDDTVSPEQVSEWLFDLRAELRTNACATTPESLRNFPSLAADLRAQAKTKNVRPHKRAVPLKIVFIDKGGEGQGLLGELLMEQIADASADGELYPAIAMAGVNRDAAWDGALTVALDYARQCGFGIAPGTDVRWSVHLLHQTGSEDRLTPRPLAVGDKLTGRSAGVSFFLGLFALAQADGARGVWDARKIVERMVALATLPETGARAADALLGTLGGDEEKKLDALDSLPSVIVVLPETYTGSVLTHHPLHVTTVAGLVEELRHRCASAIRPDYLPASSRADRYIGSRDDVERMTQALRTARLHVVTGPGGVGKTARVIEASEPLCLEERFPGGRFWIDLTRAVESGRAPDVVAAEDVASICGEKPAEKLDDLRTQTRRLLATRSSLVLLEGGETVAEGDVAALLDFFPQHATVVWMTRRETDAEHPCLRSATHHLVRTLSSADALELLCDAARRKVDELPATERADWEEIVKATECLPIFLNWAGAALRPEWDTTAAEYLAELRADPLGGIAGPAGREPNDAGQFLRRSLARIAPTAEMPDLPAVAERLFAGLAAFHPSYGAPRSWWSLAAGLDTRRADELRRFKAARRALLGLGLVTAQVPPVGVGLTTETLHAVHALAGTVAADLWHKQSVTERWAALGVLCDAATAFLEAPLPSEWFSDAAWVAGRTAEAAHYCHWLDEIEAMASEDDSSVNSLSIDPLIRPWVPWVEFLEKRAEPHPLLTLKDTAWNLICRLFQLVATAHPENPEIQAGLSGSWNRVGDVRSLREDWDGAEMAFREAMVINERLVKELPAAPSFRNALAGSYSNIGKTHKNREDLDGALRAFKRGIAISRKLVKENPEVPEFQDTLARLWDRVGQVRAERGEWPSAKAAFKKAMTINQKIAEERSDLSATQEGLLEWLDRLGRVRAGQQDWVGAETVFKEAIEIGLELIEANPNEPNHQRGLAVCWGQIGSVRQARQELEGAEEAFGRALEIHKRLVADYPDMPGFMQDLAVAWDDLAKVREARQDLPGAEEALKNALEIDSKLVAAYPDVPRFQRGLSSTWVGLGEVRKTQQKWADAETAFVNALEIDKKLVAAHPDVPDFQRNLSVSWEHLGEVRMGQQDWAGAETAFNNAVEIGAKLVAAYPDVPDFQNGLSVSWERLGDSREERQDWAGAETAFNNAVEIGAKLVAVHPDMPDFQRNLFVSWERLATVAEKRGDDARTEQALRESLRVCDVAATRWQWFEGRMILQTLRLGQMLRRLDRAEEAAALARGGLARAKQMLRRLQERGAKLIEGEEDTIARLTELAGPKAGTVG